MLIIKRKGEEAITIEPMDGIDQSQSVGELFSQGPIEITLFEVRNNAVKVAIDAPSQLKIWRGQRPRKETDAKKSAA